MIIINCTQGSPEWLQARAGVVTASMFSTARSKVNGLTAQQQKYVSAILEGRSESTARDIAGYKAGPKAEVVQRALDLLAVALLQPGLNLLGGCGALRACHIQMSLPLVLAMRTRLPDSSSVR